MRIDCLQCDVLVEHARDHLDLGLCCCNLLCGRRLRTGAAEEERHCVVLSVWEWFLVRWVVSGACVGIIIVRRLLLVDGCWSRALRSLVMERTEGEPLQLLEAQTNDYIRHLLERTVHSIRLRTTHVWS